MKWDRTIKFSHLKTPIELRSENLSFDANIIFKKHLKLFKSLTKIIFSK